MIQKKCVYNVFKCRITPFSCCELLGSFESNDEAEKFKKENGKKIDNAHFYLLIHPLEYEIKT